MNNQTLRDFRIDGMRTEKVPVGEHDGFRRYIILRPRDRYLNDMAPAGFHYAERQLCLQAVFAVEKNNTWVVWNPGWGVDIHKTAPFDYYKNQTPSKDCEFTEGDCYCDGSSLADGEKMWPSWKESAEAMWLGLEEWWR